MTFDKPNDRLIEETINELSTKWSLKPTIVSETLLQAAKLN